MEKEKYSVLVVDDEPDAIEYVDEVLADLGNVYIIAANDGNEGYTKAIEKKPDLVILDIMMPGKDGFEVFYDLRANEATRNLPVIMLTGISNKIGISFSKKNMKDYLGSEPVEYLEKPLKPEKLLKAVQKVFSTKQEVH